MDLSECLVRERRARLAAERLLEQKSRELFTANEKLAIHASRPEGHNVIEGQIKDLAYFGKDSLYRVTLPSGQLISVHAVNARRQDDRRPDWDDKVWVSFDPASAILLRD